MKKLLSLATLATALFLATTTSGYSQVFQKGDKLLNAGIGLGTYGYGGLGFGGSFEVGVTDDISVGPLVGYSGTTQFGSNFSVLTIGGRGSYHLNNILNLNNDKLDFYAGLGLAYRKVNFDYLGVGNSYGDGGILLLAHLGGRYYLSDNLGIFAEVGSGFGTLQAGVTFKF